jgi:type I restriction enzyme S subunit
MMNEDFIEQKQLGQIVTFEKGKPPAQLSYYGLDAELYLTPEYLRGRGLAESIKPSINAVRIEEGDTIVLWDGSNAGEFFRGRKGILASTMCRVKHDKAINKKYFFYALKIWEGFLKGQTSGSGIPHVDKEVVGKIEIILFKKDEQAKIAEILSSVDRAIEQTEALIAKQQRVKTGLMQDLLSRGIDENGNVRSEQTHKFKDSPLGRIPIEWEISTIGDLAVHVGSGNTPRGGETVYSQEGVLFIRSQNVYFDGLQLDDVAFISQSIHRTMLRSEVFANDLLLNITGASIGRCCVMPVIGLANVNQHVCIIRMLEPTELDSGFLAFIMESSIIQNQIIQLNAGGNREGLNYGQVRRFIIPWPPSEERNNIWKSLQKITQALNKEKFCVTKLRSLKTALMQDLLTGKKRVTALLKEAEVACV